MNYSKEEVMQYVQEENVKFIRLSFCDVFGKQKNISIMPEELPDAFEKGIPFDASAITGFGGDDTPTMFLHPDPNTLSWLPWRPEHGKVVRMYSYIKNADGTPFECDTRELLRTAVAEAHEAGYDFYFGTTQEFYLFELDEKGEPTTIPYDKAGYMDIAPDDKGENIRREICLTLEEMGIKPQTSHHGEGPGQNKISFRFSDPLTAADNALTFRMIVSTVATRNGLYADFSAKPLTAQPGNGFHINISVGDGKDAERLKNVIAGISDKISEATAFLNPNDNSFLRLGHHKAPSRITWSRHDRHDLFRVPEIAGSGYRAELRSPDPAANPYLVLTLLIRASLDGLVKGLTLSTGAGEAADTLPSTSETACRIARESGFIKETLPELIVSAYCK